MWADISWNECILRLLSYLRFICDSIITTYHEVSTFDCQPPLWDPSRDCKGIRGKDQRIPTSLCYLRLICDSIITYHEVSTMWVQPPLWGPSRDCTGIRGKHRGIPRSLCYLRFICDSIITTYHEVPTFDCHLISTSFVALNTRLHWEASLPQRIKPRFWAKLGLADVWNKSIIL